MHFLPLQLPELSQFTVGLMHIQLLHTSASLAINENWDPDVRDDMEMMLNRIVPEDVPFRHSCEGPDDMVSSTVHTMIQGDLKGGFAFSGAACVRWIEEAGGLGDIA